MTGSFSKSIVLGACLLAICMGAGVTAVEWPTRPKEGIALRGRVVDVYDGDTLTVEAKLTMRVRLIDCWAPEIRGPEKEQGLASAAYVRGLAQGKDCVLWVPASEAKTVGDLTTLGRVLGHVWLDGEKECLSRQIVAAGKATRTKAEKGD